MKSPKNKEVRTNPSVLISPLRKHRKSRIQEMEETSDDEVQLCRVRSTEGSPERPSTQRSQTPRMYHQSPQRLSCSSRIPSDASTEPLVPQTPNEGNSVSTKRKAEEPLDAAVEKARQKKVSTPIDSEELTKALRVSQDAVNISMEDGFQKRMCAHHASCGRLRFHHHNQRLRTSLPRTRIQSVRNRQLRMAIKQRLAQQTNR